MNVFGLAIPDAVIDVAILVLILLGAVLCLSAAVGLLRFRDVPSRPVSYTHLTLPTIYSV